MNEELYNLAFERSILSSIIFEPDQYNNVNLVASDFYLPAHQGIYTAIQQLVKRDDPIDEGFIKKELGTSFDEAVTLDVMSANPISNVSAYVREIKDKSIKRTTQLAMTHVRMMVIEEGKSLEEAMLYLDGVASKNTDTSSHVSIDALMNDDTLDTSLIAYQTSLDAFNQVTGGGIFFPFLYLFNGERGAGKSAAAIQIIRGLDLSHKSLFISLEMPKRMIKQRFNVIGSPVGMVLDFDSYDIADIERSIRAAHRTGAKIVLIDSLMKIKHREMATKSRMEQLGDIADRLAYIKNKLDISIILIVQASKADTQGDRKGQLSVKGAGDVDYEADIIVQITKEEDSDIREFWCTKNRANGHESKCAANFNTSTIMFAAPTGHYNSELSSTGNSESSKGGDNGRAY